MHGYFKKMFEDLDFKMENQGEKIVITIKGEKDKLEKLEKKLNALKDLHEACDDEEGGCCGCC